MPKLKTHKAAAKRFKVTAGGKILRMKGYRGHELQHCIENDHHYMLLGRWDSLEDHTVGFRESAGYQEWRKLLHHFYDPFPTVLHYTATDLQ